MDLKIKFSRNESMSNLIQETMKDVTSLLVLMTGFILVIRQKLTYGDLILLYSVSAQIIVLMTEFGRMTERIGALKSAIGRIDELIDDNGKRSEITYTLFDTINILNVSKFYGNNPAGLKNFSFKINKGEKIAIAGPTGSGKTTLMMLLLGQLTPDKGIIEIDGIDMNKIDIGHVYDNLGFVPQKNFLFNATVLENVRLFNRHFEKSDVIEACKNAVIHDRIMDLQDGYDSIIDENGSNLSEGEKQRICIARVLLKSPKIILFDEATSNLDARTEKKLFALLWSEYKHKTWLIITHRFLINDMFDKILVIENGEITAIGKHEELLRANEFYYTSYTKEKSADFKER
jgi:ATP-binding cassette subfamily B protein